jgi:hypothetical protein
LNASLSSMAFAGRAYKKFTSGAVPEAAIVTSLDRIARGFARVPYGEKYVFRPSVVPFATWNVV